MKITQTDRRVFLKNLALISLFSGTHPLITFAEKNIPMDDEAADIIIRTTEAFDGLVRQLSNCTAVDTLTKAEAMQQYQAVIKLLAVGASPDFAKASVEERKKMMREVKPVGAKPTKKDIQIVYRNLFIAGGALAVASIIVPKTVVAATMKAIAAYGPRAAGTLSIPPLAKASYHIGAGLWSIYGTTKTTLDVLKTCTAESAEVLSTQVYDKFLASGDFTFETEYPDLKVTIGQNASQAAPLDGVKIPYAEVEDFFSWLRNEIKANAVPTTDAQLSAFLDRYIEKTGAIQSQAIEKLLTAREEKNQAAINAERDKAALYQSIHSFVGNVIISRIAAPKEAAIINELIGAGFQYALSAMTPYGWAAVAINVATSLFTKSSSGGFEKAVMKALAQIQKQLNIIIEKIDVLQQNQVVIIRQLNDILLHIEKLERIVNAEFLEIHLNQNKIYNFLATSARQELENDYNDLIAKLDDIVYQKPKDSDVFRHLQELRKLAGQRLNDVSVTKYSPASFSASALKEEIYGNGDYRYNISLYDSIGLVSALHNFQGNNGVATTAILHPVEFLTVTATMVDYIILSDLDNDGRRNLTTGLLAAAKESNSALRTFADPAKIREKSQMYRVRKDALILDLLEYSRTLEKREFTEKNNLLRNFKLQTLTSIDLGKFADPNIARTQNDKTFTTSAHDNAVLNLCKDAGIVEKISIEKVSGYDRRRRGGNEFRKVPSNPDTYFPNYNVGTVIMTKTSRLYFNNVLLEFNSGLRATFDVPYEADLKIASFKDELEWKRCGGHECDIDFYYLNRRVTNSLTEIRESAGWNVALLAQLRERQIDATIIEKYSRLSFKEFLNHLINQFFLQKKYEHIQELKQYVHTSGAFSSIEGPGVAMMVLTKLNHLLLNESEVPFVIDYLQEIYVREDVMSLLESIGLTDFEGNGKGVYEILRSVQDHSKDTSPFFLKRGEGLYTDKLNLDGFSDVIAIIVNDKMLSTAKNCETSVKEINDESGEPFLTEAIAKLEWFLAEQCA